jgi:hypothetical protein
MACAVPQFCDNLHGGLNKLAEQLDVSGSMKGAQPVCRDSSAVVLQSRMQPGLCLWAAYINGMTAVTAACRNARLKCCHM